MNKRMNPYLFIVILVFCFLLFAILAQAIIKQAWDDIELNESKTISSIVNSRTDSILGQLESVYTFVDIHKNEDIDVDEFNKYSEAIIDQDNGVINISIAVDGIQGYVYPLEGNEGVLGHDLLNDDREEVRLNVNKAIDTGLITVNGPYQMRTNPGKEILVLRKAVYNDDGSFYALVNVVVETEMFFLGVDDKVKNNEVYSIQISNDDGVRLYGDNSEVAYEYELELDDFEWKIYLEFQDTYVEDTNYIKNSLNVLFLIILLSLIGSAYLFTIRNRKLSVTINEMIYFDQLTGLPNRRKLEQYYQEHMGQRFSLVFADVDDFKYLNDTYGHELGDVALKEISVRFREKFGDNVYRWGGDEFVFIIEGEGKENMDKALMVIIELMKEPLKVNDDLFTLGISIGVLLDAQKNDKLFDSIKFADMAMYSAKKTGKNKFVYYNEDQNYKLTQSVRFDQMTKTIDFEEQSTLYFQPKYSFEDNRIIGLEALFRLRFDNDYILPKGFIDAAESNGTISGLDRFVLNKVLMFSLKLKEIGVNLPISVNVSGMTLSNQFIAFLEDLNLRSANVTDMIELELTESIAVSSSEDKSRLLRKIKDLGFKISIDDFGKQHSTYQSLSTLSFDSIKIDKQFVMEIGLEHNAQIIKSIIELGQNMNVEVIAEGVETTEQYNKLKELKCNAFQGYLYSRPISFESLLGLFNEK